MKVFYGEPRPMHVGIIGVSDEAVVWKNSLDQAAIESARQAENDGRPLESVFGDKAKAVPIQAISRIRANQRDTSIKLKVGSGKDQKEEDLDLFDSAKRDEVFEEMKSRTGWVLKVTELNTFSAALTPLIGLLIVLGVGAFFYFMAKEVAEGREVDTSGRRGTMKAILVWISETLGTGGVLVVTGVFAIAVIAWMISRIKNPPIYHDLMPAK